MIRSPGFRTALRPFLLQHIQEAGLVRLACERFGITRQAVNRHLRTLNDDGAIVASGKTKDRRYKLAEINLFERSYRRTVKLEEDVIWERDILPLLKHHLPENVLSLLNYAFTEIFNNAVDHSEGSRIRVNVSTTALSTTVVITDNGIGIFEKIRSALGLLDARQSVLELAKGKFTTDRDRHSGWGIFFSSRMMDSFDILSGDVFFGHEAGRRDDYVLRTDDMTQGTVVVMTVAKSSSRTKPSVFQEFSELGSLGFDKTVVPVALAQDGNDQLVSRSQAKRVLDRIGLFKKAVFDFHEVEMIGQAFADEIFRVFPKIHPEVELVPIRANANVLGMIGAVQREGKQQATKERKATPIGERKKRK